MVVTTHGAQGRGSTPVCKCVSVTSSWQGTMEKPANSEIPLILLSPPPENWNYRVVPPSLAVLGDFAVRWSLHLRDTAYAQETEIRCSGPSSSWGRSVNEDIWQALGLHCLHWHYRTRPLRVSETALQTDAC